MALLAGGGVVGGVFGISLLVLALGGGFPGRLVVIAGLVGFVLGLVGAWFWRVARSEAARGVDRELGLPDSVISAHELAETAVPDVWRERQLTDTLGRLGNDWSRTEARAWTGPALTAAGVFVLGAVLWSQSGPRVDPVELAAREAFAEDSKELETLFADWEEAAELMNDPEFERLLRDLEPLREKLAEGEVPRKEVFLEIGRLEERLEAMRAQVAAQSLEPFAAELAEALEQAPETQALGRELRKEDFAAAGAEAERAAADAPKSLSAAAGNAARQMTKVSNSLGEAGRERAAKAMESMAAAARSGDGEKMKKALEELGQCLAQQSARQSKGKCLALQLGQLGMCKSGLANGKSLAACLSMMPKLAATVSQTSSQSAGKGSNLLRQGAETAALAPLLAETVSGTMDSSGESETTLESTSDAPRQGTASRRGADLAAYQAMSEEAIEDEAIPLAHRTTVRRYFEAIRTDLEVTP